MINAILTGIFNLIIGLVSVILAPIDLVITNLLPDLSSALDAVAQFFAVVSGGLGWAVSLTGLSASAISLIVMYFVFKLTAPIAFYMIKLAISWFRSLKP